MKSEEVVSENYEKSIEILIYERRVTLGSSALAAAKCRGKVERGRTPVSMNVEPDHYRHQRSEN